MNQVLAGEEDADLGDDHTDVAHLAIGALRELDGLVDVLLGLVEILVRIEQNGRERLPRDVEARLDLDGLARILLGLGEFLPATENLGEVVERQGGGLLRIDAATEEFLGLAKLSAMKRPS